jgi:hypothetical protein
MVDFHNEWNTVGILARHHTQNAQSSSNGITTAFKGEFNDVFWIEVAGIWAKEAPAECSIPWSTGRIER